MSGPLAVYADSLLREVAGTGAPTWARFPDGTIAPVHLGRWTSPADAVDERALRDLRGPVLDVGCGPGRHLHALSRRGIFGLGVDLSPVAVGLARGAGSPAIVASIFDELPGTGHWRSALLLDGNIGIGGRPARLLARVRELLAPDGRAVVELASPEVATVETVVRLETSELASDWFPWAEVSAADVRRTAADAGFAVVDRFTECGRWFAVLAAPATDRPAAGGLPATAGDIV